MMDAQLRPDSPIRTAKRSRSSDHSPALSSSSEKINKQDDVRLPAFLRQSIQEIVTKFEEINSQQIKRIEHGLLDSSGHSAWILNITKEHKALNRYMDIWPWEQTRVKLKVPDGLSNYINASQIRLSAGTESVERKYIAAQGPKQNNVSHFWQMVWQEAESPVVIVMLTQLTESAKEKCYQYFPEDVESDSISLDFVHENDEKYEGLVKVDRVETDEECKTTVREMTLTYNGLEKKIWHLFFQAWPDFGVPQDSDRNALFSLIKLSREKNLGWNNPRVIHCSAGVGRSGTFIALEHLIDELDHGHFDDMVTSDKDPIFDTVSRLREQRMTMVQSDLQYAFLYESLANAFRQRSREKDGESTPILFRTSSEKLNHGEPSAKAIRLSRGLRNLFTEIRSRSSSRRRREVLSEANESVRSEATSPITPISKGKIP